MKNPAIKKACALLTVLLAASSVWAAVYQERDEINRSFTLRAGARVDVSAINGNVDIKAIDGDTATVQIERSARSRTELDCNKVVVEQGPAGNLIIASENRSCGTIQVAHRVLLSLPRYVNVIVHGVSGSVNIGEIDGTLRIFGNTGPINLARSGRNSIITGNMGTTTIKLQQLDARGLNLSGHMGDIKLLIADDSNVVVRVSGFSGSVSSELPNMKFHKTRAADYAVRIGFGGPTIHVDGSQGSISLIPYRE